jgi:hypothetical protein
MAAGSSSSSSSYSYSSSAYTPGTSYASTPQAHSSSAASSWSPSPAVSGLTDEPSAIQGLRPLDLGPPGYQATIILFENTAQERTVYLGPWNLAGSEHRRIIWQCSYQMEQLEHFLPSPVPSDIVPHTLHGRHRQFCDAFQLEQHVTFHDRHRLRYTDEHGSIILDQYVEVKYDFTTVESSLRFQGDIRRKDLVDCFDTDVVWTDNHSRTDSFGNVKGIGTIQRLKLWSDQYNSAHSITVFANRTDRRCREYLVEYFEPEPRSRDDRRRSLRLAVRGRRGSTHDGRRLSLSSAFRPRQRSGSSSGSASSPLDIRYLAIQFSSDQDYRRFHEAWALAHGSDAESRSAAYPQDRFELPSPEIPPGVSYELPAPHLGASEMHTVLEAPETMYDHMSP